MLLNSDLDVQQTHLNIDCKYWTRVEMPESDSLEVWHMLELMEKAENVKANNFPHHSF